MLIAKARKPVEHFNHSSTVCKKLKNIQVIVGSSDSMKKTLLLMQDVKTKLNSTYYMLKRQEKLKLSFQSYVANNKNFKPKNIHTADELKLVSLLIELLEPFYVVTQQCSKTTHCY